MDERRSSPRIDAGIPAEFDTASEPGHAGILQDVSETGALLLSRVEHAAGDGVTVRFRASGPDGELVERRATVVRSGDHSPESIWSTRAALAFERAVELDRDALKE